MLHKNTSLITLIILLALLVVPSIFLLEQRWQFADFNFAITLVTGSFVGIVIARVFPDLSQEVLNEITFVEQPYDLKTYQDLEAERQLRQEIEANLDKQNSELQGMALRLTVLIESLEAGVIIQDSTQRSVLLNQAFCDLFDVGVVAPALIGADFSDFAERYQNQFANPAKFIQEYEQVLRERRTVTNKEIKLRDGRILELDYVPIFLDSCYDGNLCMYRDVTARKLTEINLEENQNFLHNILDTNPNLIFVKDVQGNFTLVNKAVADLYQSTVESLVGERDIHFQAPKSSVSENKITTPTGEVRYFQTTEIPLQSLKETKPLTLGIAIDVTERKRTEIEAYRNLAKERHLNDLKTKFIDMASHQFRTPLTSILGFAELLERYQEKLTPEKQLKYLQNIQSSAVDMQSLLDDVLNISRVDAGKISLDLVPLDLEEFTRQLVEEIQVGVGKENQLNLTLLKKSKRFYLDEKLIRHILLNLLSNAIKYSKPGSQVEFEISYDLEERRISFLISDQGIGIPIEDQVHLFESFHRGTNTSIIPGTGLGLHIVKKYVELHKGQIFVASSVELGTTFKIYIPITGEVL